MARLRHRTLSSRTVGRLKVERDTVFWDRELTGFGVRVYPSGGKVYVAQARGPGGPKRVTVGRHGVLSAEQARQRAALIIARVKAGETPVPEPMAARHAGGPTVGELAERFLEEYAAVRYKPATMAWTRTMVRRHIVPEFGRLPLEALERAQVTELHHRLYESPSTANKVVRTLSLMYRLAEGWGHGAGGVQPLPLGRQIPRARTRAVPDRRGVHPARKGARRSRNPRRRIAVGSSGASSADAHRVPGSRKSSPCDGSMWRSEPASCACPIPRQVRAWCRCRPRQ